MIPPESCIGVSFNSRKSLRIFFFQDVKQFCGFTVRCLCLIYYRLLKVKSAFVSLLLNLGASSYFSNPQKSLSIPTNQCLLMSWRYVCNTLEFKFHSASWKSIEFFTFWRGSIWKYISCSVLLTRIWKSVYSLSPF